MKKLGFYLILILFVGTKIAGATDRLLPEHDIEYLGAFRVPTDSSSNYSWGWISSQGLVYNPVNNTLISPAMRTPGHTNFGKVTEFTIPTPIKSAGHNLTDLQVATTIHDWTDITEGKWNQNFQNPLVAGMAILPPRGSQTSYKLYWLTTSWWGPLQDVATLGMSNLNFSTPNARGPWRITGSWAGNDPTPSAKTSRYMFNIPQGWADQYVNGYSLGTGENKPNNNGSRGACIYAVKPWDTETPPTSGSDIDSIELLCPGMDFAHRRNYEKSSWDDFSYLDQQNSAIWVTINNKAAVMFTGSIGTLTAADTGDCDPNIENCEYYKTSVPGDNDTLLTPVTPPSASPDACEIGHDYRSEPYYRVLWLYDVNDLQAVAQGKKKSYEPQPYTIFNLENYLWAEGRCVLSHIGGIAYDETNQRIFITELQVDTLQSQFDIKPIIHVFRIIDKQLPADTWGPSGVKNLTVTFDQQGAHIDWEAGTDDNGPLLYIVYRNNKPIIATTNTSYLDDKVYLFKKNSPPKLNYIYKVETRDAVNNKSLEINPD